MGGTNFAEWLIYLPPSFYISSLKIGRTQIHVVDQISMCFTWLSSIFFSFKSFTQIKEGGSNFLGGTNSEQRLNYLVLSLYFKFKNLKDPSSLSFVRFWYILHDSEVLFSVFENFFKIKRGTWHPGRGDKFCWTSELFGPPPFYISLLQIWRAQILCYWSGFNAFYMIQL